MAKRIAIAELDGVALDWAVNVAQSGANGPGMKEMIGRLCLTSGSLFRPSRDWSQCGPLIERYKVGLEQTGDRIYAYLPDRGLEGEFGETPLIAACRAIVAAHNPSGYVEVPDELVEG